MYYLIIILNSILIGSTQLNLNEETSVKFETANPQTHRVQVSLGQIEFTDETTNYGDYLKLQIPGYHLSRKIGFPELPQINQLIEIPIGATPHIEILNFTITEHHISEFSNINQIFPVQPSISKSQSPGNLPFKFESQIYSTNKFINNEIVEVDIKGQMRAIRIANLMVKPVDYNPITGILKIYSNIEFDIHFDGADFALTEELKQKYYSPYFESLYQQINNYQSTFNREQLSNYPVTYLIITNPIFENTLSEFIDWKKQKGFNVIVANTNNIGSSTENIKNYIQNLYENPTTQTPSPSFILLVGDVAQIPTYNGTTGSHPTDLYYAEMTGDMIPEIYHGRFSAENPNQLQAQINKTIEYEKYLMPDPSYLENVLMVSGVDAAYAPTYGNGQINYGNTYYFNQEHNIISHTYLYPESDAPGAASLIIDDYNQGVGFANYTAHCSSSGWADPSFTTYDVPNLTNQYQYNLMIGNCCTSTAFDQSISFGEAILRIEDMGAIGYIGGTDNTYWNEDYWWGVGSGNISANPTYENTGLGVYDGLFHENGENYSEWFVVNDAINMAGNLAVSEAGGMEDYYWEIYHNMGDPSITTYLGIPPQNNVSYLPIIQIGNDIFNVTADPYSHIALYMDGVLYGSAFTGESNSVDMEIIPLSQAGTALITVTSQNKQPYIGNVEVGNADGPYIVIDDYSIISSDNDNIIEFNETIDLSIDLKNLGNETTTDVTVNLDIEDQFISILNNDYLELGDISPQTTLNISNFSFIISPNIPNNYSFPVEVTISGSNQTWVYNVNLTAYAPVLNLEGVSVNSNDGQLDPGDTAEIEFMINNTGGSNLNNINILLNTDDQYVTIDENNYFIQNINANDIMNSSFNINVASSTPINHVISFNLFISASDNYEESIAVAITVGLTIEDFENGSFTGNLPWSFSGQTDWDITDEAYEGNHAARSGEISHYETTELIVTANVMVNDNLSFFYKVSSETNFDYLRFYIDNSEVDSWSGEIDWSEAVYPITTGQHTFRWSYTKDGSVDSGDDKAWIDYILFPPIGPPSFPDINIDIEEFNIDIEFDAQINEQFIISNIGENELLYTIETTLNSEFDLQQHTNQYLKLNKDEMDPRESSAPTRDSGGPDAFGYIWIDSNEADGPLYNWIEINTLGIPVGQGDDLNEGPFDLGFNFYFYGNEYNTVNICTNGFLSFTSTSSPYTNQPIPSNGQINNFIAPFWDDLNPNAGGQIYYYSTDNEFIVEWDGVEHYSGGGPETFQVILNSNGDITYNYKIVDAGSSCTVGIQNSDASDGLQIVFNDSYLQSEMSIKLSSEHIQPWLEVVPQAGIIEPLNENLITLFINSTDLFDGNYSAVINVLSNDPDEMSITIPLNLSVSNMLLGDVNNSGYIDVVDIVLIVNNILSNTFINSGDLNQDDELNVTDIVLLVQLILNQ